MGYVWQVVGQDLNAVPKVVSERERQLEAITNKLSQKVLDSYESFSKYSGLNLVNFRSRDPVENR
jgi:hypothetical protein